MKTRLPSDQQITGFQLTNVRKLSKDDTLGSDIPEEIIVAILTDHATKDPGRVIEQIIRKLQHATGSKDLFRYNLPISTSSLDCLLR